MRTIKAIIKKRIYYLGWFLMELGRRLNGARKWSDKWYEVLRPDDERRLSDKWYEV